MKILNLNNNSNNFNILDEKIGDVLNKFPITKVFFDKYNIDYCCNGRKELKASLEELNILNQTVINELINYVNQSKQFVPSNSDQVIDSTNLIKKNSEEIIDFIINKFHEELRKTLPEINTLLLKIMRAHIHNHKDLFWKIHELTSEIETIFDGHLILEEELIFKPMIKFNHGEISTNSEEYKTMINCINEAMNEHFTIGPALKELAKLTYNYTIPEDACETVKKVYRKMHILQDNILAHTQVENNILFQRYLSNN